MPFWCVSVWLCPGANGLSRALARGPSSAQRQLKISLNHAVRFWSCKSSCKLTEFTCVNGENWKKEKWNTHTRCDSLHQIVFKNSDYACVWCCVSELLMLTLWNVIMLSFKFHQSDLFFIFVLPLFKIAIKLHLKEIIYIIWIVRT